MVVGYVRAWVQCVRACVYTHAHIYIHIYERTVQEENVFLKIIFIHLFHFYAAHQAKGHSGWVPTYKTNMTKIK